MVINIGNFMPALFKILAGSKRYFILITPLQKCQQQTTSHDKDLVISGFFSFSALNFQKQSLIP